MGARRVVVGMVAAAVGVLGLLPANAVAAEVDTTPPVLRSVSFSTTQAQPGQDVVITVDAADDVALARVTVVLYEATSGQSSVSRSTVGATTFTARIGTNWANGDWRVARVDLMDTAANTATYVRDGRLTTTPPTTTTHGVDLAGPGFTVSQATDWSPPVLRALEPAASPTEPDTVGFAWQIDLKGRELTELRTVWGSAEDPDNPFSSTVTTPAASGSATVTLPRGGRWHLRFVELGWSGLRTVYRDNGELQPRQGAPALHHDLDFAALDEVVSPDAPSVSVVARATKVSTYVDTVPGRAEGVTGYRVTVQPADVVRVVPVAQAGADGRLAVDVADLPNGVEQTVSVTSLSGYGTSAVVTRRARPVLASTVVAIPSRMWSSDLVATRPRGTTTDVSAYRYDSTGAGGLKGPFLVRENNPDVFPPCQALVGYSLGADASPSPLCQRDDLVSLDYRDGPRTFGTKGWSALRFVDGGFDLTGDGRADVIAVDAAGQLLLYAQSSTGTLVARPRIGTGWQSMVSVVSVGDLTGDRKNDIAAVDASGRLWLYPGNGKGGVTARRQVGSGWHRMGALLAMRDFDHDGRIDLGGITPTGDLVLYRGTGTGGVRPGLRIGTGWQRYL